MRQGADAGLEREETSKDMCGEIFEKEMKEVSYGRQNRRERDRDKEGEGERTEKREQMLGRNVDSIAKGTDLGQVLVI